MVKSVAVAFAVAVAAASWSAAGPLSGTVTVEGAPAGDAVVYVTPIPGKTFPPPAAHAVMDQRDMHFLPHVLVVMKGTTVDFENHDTVDHNVFSPDACAPAFDLGTWGNGGVRSHTFDKPCKAVILCAIHPDMEAYVVVVPTPFFATTSADGSYAITDLPDGRYTVSAWHEGAAEASKEVEVSGPTALNLALRK